MQHSKQSVRRSSAFLMGGVIALTSGCGGGGGDSSDPNGPGAPATDDVSLVTTEQAQQSATDVVKNDFGVSVSRAVSLVMNSKALEKSIEAVGAGDGPGGADSGGSSPESITAQAEDAVISMFSNPVRDNGTITYTPTVVDVCAQPFLTTLYGSTLAGRQECEDLFSHVTIVQTVVSETEGTITYKFDEFAPLVVGYSATVNYIEMDLAQYAAAVEAAALVVNPNEPLDYPDTFSGVVRVTEVSTGENAATLTVAVRTPIVIAGMLDGQNTSLEIAETDKLIEVAADGDAQTGSIELAVGAISANFPVDNPFTSGIVHAGQFDLAALTGKLDINNATDSLVVTNFGLGGQPLTVRIDGQETTRIALDTFDMSADGATGVASFDSPLNFAFDFNNVEGIIDDTLAVGAQGGLTVNADATTAFTVVDNSVNASGAVFQVTAGQISFNGTGIFAGSLAAVPGSCYTEASTEAFPVVEATCP